MPVHPNVDAYFSDQAAHPMIKEMVRVRDIILGAHPDITEDIKWQVPTFMYKGNIASFMKAKKLVSLMFHMGATIDDPFGLLEGEGKEARVARFYSLADIEDKKPALEAVVQAWVRSRI